ncbi:MAG TPA: thioredoxin-disulfide reductase [Thermoplasmatales archaeon]|nr:thioredoxin-disulfide reductase [Thermoplasmatales archaeon]
MNRDYELAIIGAGPAGCSAAIYAGRSGIKSVVFDKGMGGGLTSTAPKIENYPGFPEISGIELVQKLIEHAKHYADIHLNEEVKDIKKEREGFVVITNRDNYLVKAAILSTGSTYKKLNIPGEKEFSGRGVSYCATCDGFFFKGKSVAVIGGGNTALLEAIYLKQVGCKEVYLIHRRDVLRGESVLQDEAREKGINILLNKIVKRIEGKDVVERIVLEDLENNEEISLGIQGIFVAVGEKPENTLAVRLGVSIDEHGYIITDDRQRTNLKGIYAAGDITGGVRQVVTACAEGAIAALTSTEVLGKKYPY